MRLRIRTICIIFVLVMLVAIAGISDVSATKSAKDNYKKVYPKFPDPAPNEPKNCVGLCHLAPWDKHNPILSKYAIKLNNLAKKKYGKSFKKLNDAEKQDILKMAGSGVTAKLNLNPLKQDIKVGTVGHYILGLTTNFDAFGGTLDWKTDDPNLTAGIDAAPSSDTGSIVIPTNSNCVGTPDVNQECKANFDVQVEPGSGMTLNEPHTFRLAAFSQNDVTGTAVVTGGVVPIPELATGILMVVGLIGLIGLVRIKRS